MPSPVNDFSRLMQRVAEGDPNAFTQLFHLYNPALLAQLRNRLDKFRCLRCLFEAEDLAQDIWLRFATGSPRRRQFPTPGHFRRYLARTARNKILKAARDQLGTQKRDARRCHYLSETSAGAVAAVVADPSPTPDRIAEVRDECERWLSSLTNEQQLAARMIGRGFKHEQIATMLICSERTIERLVGRMRYPPTPAPLACA